MIVEQNQPLPLAPPSALPAAAPGEDWAFLAGVQENSCFRIGNARMLLLLDPQHTSTEASLRSLVMAKVQALRAQLGQEACRYTFYIVARPLSLAAFHQLYFQRLSLFSLKYFYPAGEPISLLEAPPAASSPKKALRAVQTRGAADAAIAAIFSALCFHHADPYYHLKETSSAMLPLWQTSAGAVQRGAAQPPSGKPVRPGAQGHCLCPSKIFAGPESGAWPSRCFQLG